jgi:hypothetical protein
MACFLFLVAASLSTFHEDYKNQDVDLSDIDWEDSIPDVLHGDAGGAFSATNLSLLAIIRCQFVSCGCQPDGLSGGVGFIQSAYPFNVTVLDSTIKDCYANSGGGAFFFATPPNISHFSNVIFSNTTAYRSIGGALAFPRGCGCAQIQGCQFRGCTVNGTGGAISVNGPNSWLSITNSQFEQNCAQEGGALWATSITSLVITVTTFSKNAALELAVALSLSDVSNIAVDGCQFSFEKAALPGRVSIALRGNIQDIMLLGCCFNSTAAIASDSTPAHIYGDFDGSIAFQLPMCFDTTKEKSLKFVRGQDPGGILDIFNCQVCLPVPTAPLSPFATDTESQTPPSTPVATGVPPPPTDDPDKLTTGEVVGISVGSSAVLVLIIVVVVLGVGLCGPRKRRDAIVPHQLLSSDPLLPPE